MSLRHRHTGVGLRMSAWWLMAFLTVYADLAGFEKVGWKVWIWFAIFNILGFPYVYFFLRERQGRSLKHTSELYNEELAIDSRTVAPGEEAKIAKAPGAIVVAADGA
ncbi:hypothetical protein NX059_001838 [Plenodomus lindquistii]|nr:hypothetical protein NX059_001838 [Plenodomus lindquistii]